MKTVKGTLDCGRFRIPYRRYGDQDNVLLCVSGAMQTMAVWRTVARRFSPHFTVVVFDMPGVGRSEILEGPPQVTVQEQMDVLRALYDDLAPRGDLTLAGSSWGTAIATAFAAVFPDRVQHLVLSSFGMKPNEVMTQIVQRAVEYHESGELGFGVEDTLDRFAPQIGDAYRRQIVTQFANLSETSADVFVEHCRNILSLGRLQDTVDLAQITARTLIINGDEDRIIDLEDMWVAQKLIPDCECRLVEGVGHFLHFERPELLDDYEDFMVTRASACAVD